MNPCAVLIEIPVGADDYVNGETQTYLARMRQIIAHEVREPYVSQEVHDLNPTWFAYPIRRPRVMLLFWRADLVSSARSMSPLATIMAGPLPMADHVLGFLKMTPDVDWSRCGEIADAGELATLAQSQCDCSVDPSICCALHPCRCGACGVTGIECTWRAKATKYLRMKAPAHVPVPGAPRRLTYLNVVEMSERTGPTSARERNLLNIFACLHRCYPLGSTLAVVDRGQQIDRTTTAFDGSVPTLAQNSAMHSMQMGKCFTTADLAALMGIRLEKTDLNVFTERTYQAHLGQSIHVAVMGAMLLALVAPMTHQQGM